MAGLRTVRSSLQLVGLAAMLGALIALGVPVALGSVDRAGLPIACGTGWHSDVTTAGRVDALNGQQHTLAGPAFVTSDYVGECTALIADRRRLATTVSALGAVLVLATIVNPFALAGARSRARREPDWVSARTSPILLDDTLSRA